MTYYPPNGVISFKIGSRFSLKFLKFLSLDAIQFGIAASYSSSVFSCSSVWVQILSLLSTFMNVKKGNSYFSKLSEKRSEFENYKSA